MTTETPFAQKRREAHVIIRALDSIIFADERDVEAASRIVNRLWKSGTLTGIPLEAQIVDYLTKAHRKQYARSMESAA